MDRGDRGGGGAVSRAAVLSRPGDTLASLCDRYRRGGVDQLLHHGLPSAAAADQAQAADGADRRPADRHLDHAGGDEVPRADLRVDRAGGGADAAATDTVGGDAAAPTEL